MAGTCTWIALPLSTFCLPAPSPSNTPPHSSPHPPGHSTSSPHPTPFPRPPPHFYARHPRPAGLRAALPTHNPFPQATRHSQLTQHTPHPPGHSTFPPTPLFPHHHTMFARALDVTQGLLDYVLGQKYRETDFGSASTASEVASKHHTRIRGRVFFITGATSGIGREVAFVLARYGATVVLASRNAEKLQETMEDIQRVSPHATVHTITLDLASHHSVDQAIRDYHALDLPMLHCLICNAGIAFTWHALAPNKDHDSWHHHNVELQVRVCCFLFFFLCVSVCESR